MKTNFNKVMEFNRAFDMVSSELSEYSCYEEDLNGNIKYNPLKNIRTEIFKDLSNSSNSSNSSLIKLRLDLIREEIDELNKRLEELKKVNLELKKQHQGIDNLRSYLEENKPIVDYFYNKFINTLAS